MIEAEVKYPSPLIGWGYVASRIVSLLKPYKEDKPFRITKQDKFIIEKGESLFESALIGCESLESIDSFTQLFVYREDSFTLPPASAFHTALNILISSPIARPENLSGIKDKLSQYKNLLQSLKTSEPCKEKHLLDEIRVFFLKINEQADLESYRSSSSSF